MKKFIGCFLLMALLPAAFMAGCGSKKTPTSPGGTSATAAVSLGTAGNYVVLAATGITNTGATTLTGGLGSYPSSAVALGIVINGGGVSNVANGTADIAEQNLGTAYTNVMNRTGGTLLTAGGDIGGQTLHPGLYTDGGDILVSSADVTLDAQGVSTALFIFQVAGNITTAASRQVILVGSAQAANVYWQVAGLCALNTSVNFVGTVMAHTSVTFGNGATLVGRALAETGDVTLQGNTITTP